MNRYTTDYFSWYKPEKSFTACLSTLNIRAIYPQPEQFELESTRTGKVIKFVLSHTDRDREGDIRFWEYKCLTHPFKAVIFND